VGLHIRTRLKQLADFALALTHSVQEALAHLEGFGLGIDKSPAFFLAYLAC
jgi:hypothetical protein